MKRVYFIGTTRKDLAGFPESVRRRAGHELFMVQVGRMPSDFKPIPEIGVGTYEIRVQDEAGAFRVIYVAKFDDAIYVLHAFQKKTRGTAKTDMDLAANRYKLISEKL